MIWQGISRKMYPAQMYFKIFFGMRSRFLEVRIWDVWKTEAKVEDRFDDESMFCPLLGR